MKRLTIALLVGLLVLAGGLTLQAEARNRTQPPSIRACGDADWAAITTLLLDTTADMDALNDAASTADLDQIMRRALFLHDHWFDSAPDLPYCAQAVHTRLLMDRTIDMMTLGYILTVTGYFDDAKIYQMMLDLTLEDLTTYQGILESYSQ